jgi:hypothetical protein
VTSGTTADLVIVKRSSTGWSARVHHSTGSSFVALGQGAIDAYTGMPDYVLAGDVDGDERADIVTGFVGGDTVVDWKAQLSTGCQLQPRGGGALFVEDCFGGSATWRNNAGDAGDFFRLGDLNLDGRSDLLLAYPLGLASKVKAPILSSIGWYGHLGLALGFGARQTLRTDASDEGDVVP